MDATATSDGLGPLPQSRRNKHLETLSRRALEAVLPPDCFTFRDEPVGDAGVDGALEVLVNSRDTNLRAQVQLKATDSTAINADGSVSLLIDTSNLNYLLNGPSPLYVLFVAPRNELRFAWARDEWRRLQRTNPDWAEQVSVTIRFERLLTTAALDEIHARIRREALSHRRTLESLTLATLAERVEHVTLRIDAEMLTSLGADEAAPLLLTAGTTLVSSGFASTVLDLCALVPRSSEAGQSPRLHLLAAYACYTLGWRQTARGHVAEASRRASDLSREDKRFLRLLRAACELEDGALISEGYEGQFYPPGPDGDESGDVADPYDLGHRLHYLHHALWQESDFSRRRPAHLGDERPAARIMASSDTSASFRLNAELTLLHAEGIQMMADFFEATRSHGPRRAMGGPVDLPALVADLAAKHATWESQVEDARAVAARMNSLLNLGQARATRIAVRAIYLYALHLVSRIEPIISLRGGWADLLSATIEEARQVIALYARLDVLEKQLHAKIWLADLHELAGQVEEAERLGHEAGNKTALAARVGPIILYAGIRQRYSRVRFV
jgi:hypothetical protein